MGSGYASERRRPPCSAGTCDNSEVVPGEAILEAMFALPSRVRGGVLYLLSERGPDAYGTLGSKRVVA